MRDRLLELESRQGPIRVGLIGAGVMGCGIIWQINRTPGMQVCFVGDISPEVLKQSEDLLEREVVYGENINNVSDLDKKAVLSNNPLKFLEDNPNFEMDVLVESTNAITAAARYCYLAIERGWHVVLMNAEIDLALGIDLHRKAKEKGVVVTSDAGDQHGVLMTMIEEILLWDFEIIQAGNIKGFLNKHATISSLIEEARIRNLNPIQCCAYTDGTKLSIEMALVGNALGFTPKIPGMEGPRAKHVQEALNLFDFDSYDSGHIDYLLGAEPGGGVYVIGKSEDNFQKGYLSYYKLGEGPYYLFYRPYHLCHLETTRAIAQAYLDKKAILSPDKGRVCEVYSYAKRDISKGENLTHGIGCDLVYGIVDTVAKVEKDGHFPIVLADMEGNDKITFKNNIPKDQVVTWDDINIPDNYLLKQFNTQLS